MAQFSAAWHIRMVTILMIVAAIGVAVAAVLSASPEGTVLVRSRTFTADGIQRKLVEVPVWAELLLAVSLVIAAASFRRGTPRARQLAFRIGAVVTLLGVGALIVYCLMLFSDYPTSWQALLFVPLSGLLGIWLGFYMMWVASWSPLVKAEWQRLDLLG